MAKAVIKTAFRTDLADRNELFFPGRMAYVMELEEEAGHNDETEVWGIDKTFAQLTPQSNAC